MQAITIRICGSLLLLLVPNVSDYVLGAILNRPLTRAVIDTLTHGVLGLLTWIVFDPGSMSISTSKGNSKGWCWCICGNSFVMVFCLACLIDIDHFLSARSIFPADALRAPHRGIFHCSGLMLLVNAFLLCLNWRFALIFAVSWIPHHLRDATRRGIYLHPPQFHSKPLDPNLVTILTITFPWLLAFVSNQLAPLNQPTRQILTV